MPYVYQADVWCDDCGKKIMSQIAMENPKAVPEDVDDESSYDSGEWPKEYDPEAESSDSPQNCADGECGGQYWVGYKLLSYGKFLGGMLTAEGYKNLKEMLDEYRPGAIPEYAKEWAEFYGFEYHENEWSSAHDWLRSFLIDAAEDCLAAKLLNAAQELANALDADTIQDLFQDEMEDDGYFKEAGWYSDEME